MCVRPIVLCFVCWAAVVIGDVRSGVVCVGYCCSVVVVSLFAAGCCLLCLYVRLMCLPAICCSVACVCYVCSVECVRLSLFGCCCAVFVL